MLRCWTGVWLVEEIPLRLTGVRYLVAVTALLVALKGGIERAGDLISGRVRTMHAWFVRGAVVGIAGLAVALLLHFYRAFLSGETAFSHRCDCERAVVIYEDDVSLAALDPTDETGFFLSLAEFLFSREHSIASCLSEPVTQDSGSGAP